jgi:hypothetical protein
LKKIQFYFKRPKPLKVENHSHLAFTLGQRCKGRNFLTGRRCCTPENPCDEGEGDCDGRGDGGFNDGDCGCKGDLVCGSNKCLQFGFYYHEKDDCCEKQTVGAEIEEKICSVAE